MPNGSTPGEAPNSDVALLVDWENLKFSLAQRGRAPTVDTLREAAERFGRVVYARAYADWEDDQHRGDPSKLYTAGLEPVYVLAKHYQDPASGEVRIKNSVDVKLAADCIEASHLLPNVGTFIIVSGDNDFLHIVNTLRPRGKKVVVIGVSWTTAAHLTQQADEVLYYDLDLEGVRGKKPAETAPAVTKIEPSVTAVADTIIHEMPGEEVESLGRPVGEALNLILAIVKEFREAKRELSVSLLGQELQKRMAPGDFQRIGRGKASQYTRALRDAKKLQIVTHDFQDWIFLPGESTEMYTFTQDAPPAPRSYDLGSFTWMDLNANDKDRVIVALQDERMKPATDWLTFTKALAAVRTVVNRDEFSLKNLVNSMVQMQVLRQVGVRTGYDPETRKQFSYPTFDLEYESPDVRRALKLA